MNYRLHSANFGKRKKEIAKEVANIQKEYVEALDLQKEEKDKIIDVMKFLQVEPALWKLSNSTEESINR